MSIGMFTAREIRDRLDKIEIALGRRDLNISAEDRADLEVARDELRGWLMDLWRVEGGGAR